MCRSQYDRLPQQYLGTLLNHTNPTNNTSTTCTKPAQNINTGTEDYTNNVNSVV